MLGIIGSFQPEFYKRIVKQNLSKSFGFLAVFLILVSLIISFKYTAAVKRAIPEMNLWIQENFENITAGLPEIKIEDGILLLPQQYYIKEWGDSFAFVVEPDQNKIYSELEKYSNALVLSKTKFLLKNTKHHGSSEMKVYDLKEIEFLNIIPAQDGLRVVSPDKDFDLTPFSIEDFIDKASVFIYPFLSIWFFFVYSFNKLLQILFFSLVSLMIAKSVKQAFSYKHLLNIGIYAVVPPTAAAIGKELLNFNIPQFWIIYSFIYVVYLFWGIKASSDVCIEEERSNG